MLLKLCVRIVRAGMKFVQIRKGKQIFYKMHNFLSVTDLSKHLQTIHACGVN